MSAESPTPTTPTNVRDIFLDRLAQFPNAYKCWEMTRDSPQHPVEALHAGAEYPVFDTEELSGVAMTCVRIGKETIPLSLFAENHCGMRLYRMSETSVPVHGREMSFADACADPNIATTNCVSTVGHSHLIGFWDPTATDATVPQTNYLARAIRNDGSLYPTARAWATDETGGPHIPEPNGPRFPIGAFAYELSIRETDPMIPFERATYGGTVARDAEAFVKCLNSDLERVFVRHAAPPL
jgi:hypothetical protein